MAQVEVLKKKPTMVSPYSVPGYRPATMDVPTGPVLKTGPRRPGAGFQADMTTKAPGAITKPMGTGTPDRIPDAQRRRTRLTVKPPDRLGLPGRVIIPNTGISLANSNR